MHAPTGGAGGGCRTRRAAGRGRDAPPGAADRGRGRGPERVVGADARRQAQHHARPGGGGHGLPAGPVRERGRGGALSRRLRGAVAAGARRGRAAGAARGPHGDHALRALGAEGGVVGERPGRACVGGVAVALRRSRPGATAGVGGAGVRAGGGAGLRGHAAGAACAEPDGPRAACGRLGAGVGRERTRQLAALLRNGRSGDEAGGGRAGLRNAGDAAHLSFGGRACGVLATAGEPARAGSVVRRRGRATHLRCGGVGWSGTRGRGIAEPRGGGTA